MEKLMPNSTEPVVKKKETFEAETMLEKESLEMEDNLQLWMYINTILDEVE